MKLRSTANGQYRLKYDLPSVLVGRASVDLDGTRDANGIWHLSGPDGTATCTEVGTQITCNETLGGVRVDLAGVQVAIGAMGVSDAEAAARLAVATQFSVDPLGVLVFDRVSRSHHDSHHGE